MNVKPIIYLSWKTVKEKRVSPELNYRLIALELMLVLLYYK